MTEAEEVIAAVNRLEKPSWGEPCNGCGMCCTVEVCGLALVVLGVVPAPCPAMDWDGARFRCGLVTTPSRYTGRPADQDLVVGTIAARMLGVGRGCDSDDP